MFGFSDLEERLLTTDRSEVLESIRSRLDALREQAQEELGRGLSPHDFATAQSFLSVINISERILAAHGSKEE